MGLKTMLCCIGRMENLYIREYVEYYKKLGVTNICLYDNNYDGEDDFRDVIGDYIDSGFVILIDARNVKGAQTKTYEHCYNTYGNDYDWLMFFDCDEFLYLENHKNVSDFLSQPIYDDFNAILLSWKTYDDNDLLYYDNRPLLERFTRECSTMQYYVCWRYYTKTILRGGQGELIWRTQAAHFPERFVSKGLKVCNAKGEPPVINSPNLYVYKAYVLLNRKNTVFVFPKYKTMDVQYEVAYIKHIETKTIEEFCKIKNKRRWPDGNNSKLDLNYFFEKNKRTPEKEELGKKLLEENIKGIAPINTEEIPEN